MDTVSRRELIVGAAALLGASSSADAAAVVKWVVLSDPFSGFSAIGATLRSAPVRRQRALVKKPKNKGWTATGVIDVNSRTFTGSIDGHAAEAIPVLKYDGQPPLIRSTADATDSIMNAMVAPWARRQNPLGEIARAKTVIESALQAVLGSDLSKTDELYCHGLLFGAIRQMDSAKNLAQWDPINAVVKRECRNQLRLGAAMTQSVFERLFNPKP